MVQPVLFLIAWSLFMLVWLYVTRLPVIVRLASTLDWRSNARHRLPPEAQWPADNYTNLMEQPTLFYALCLGIHLVELTTPDMVYLAWLYVAFRMLHSIVQATSNIMPIRFGLFICGSLALVMLCVLAVRAAFVF